MPGCCPWNCLGFCRRSTGNFQPAGDGNAPIELQPITRPANPVSNPVVPSSQGGSSSAPYRYGEREMSGELRQRWIDDAHAPKCTVKPLNFEFKDLTHNKSRTQRWVKTYDRWGPSPPVLSADLDNCHLPAGRQDYHDVRITKRAKKEHPTRGMGTNAYHIMTAMGVIIARILERYDGPHWSEVAHAQYNAHFDQNTLRHIYLVNVVNPDTRDFIQTLWAQIQPEGSPDFMRSPEAMNQVAWAYDTPEYQAILGTELGKGVAAIVLSAFPRGTRRITRIVVWRELIMQIRFDIEHKDYLDTELQLDEPASNFESSG